MTIRALREERDRLQAAMKPDEELLQQVQERLRPNQENLALVLDLLKRYQPTDGADTESFSHQPDDPSFGRVRAGRGMSQALDAAKAYLRTKGSRAPSPEIFRALVRQGLLREDQRAVLSSYLSRSKDIFDNKKGEGGYGLREWPSAKPYPTDGGSHPMTRQ